MEIRVMARRGEGVRSIAKLGPATRRTGAYRDGTLTLWTGAACSSTSSPLRVQSSLCFVTHHREIIGGVIDRQAGALVH